MLKLVFRTFIKHNYLKIDVYMTTVIKKNCFIYLLSCNSLLAMKQLSNFINTLNNWGLVHARMRSLPV